MAQVRNRYEILVKTREGKRPLARLRCSGG